MEISKTEFRLYLKIIEKEDIGAFDTVAITVESKGVLNRKMVEQIRKNYYQLACFYGYNPKKKRFMQGWGK